MKKKTVAFSVMVSLVLLAGVAWAQGGIVVVHGHQGHIEYQDRVLSSRQHLGWGLDFEQSSGLFNWIHYYVPTPYFTKTRFLALKFTTGSADIGITQIDVYNGRMQIFVLSGLNLWGDTYKDDWYLVDMGGDKVIDSGLGVSLEVGAGVEMMSHRVQIFSVAGEWHQ